MKQYFVKIKNWIKEDLKRTDLSLTYILAGVRVEKLDEKVRKEVAEISPIANYNYNLSHEEKVKLAAAAARSS